MSEAKQQRIEWLARVYSHDPDAITDEAADEHLFERMEGFGMDAFLATFRPLVKLREARGDVQFEIRNITHEAPDLSFAELVVGDEVVFILRIRFEEDAPHHIYYWGSYPPLPEGVTVRTYQPEDAAGVVALERACPMELADGSAWVIDRADAFNDYLELMDQVDAAVVTRDDSIIGFFSCALRPVGWNNEDAYAVYQHHYRVHPDHRGGSVSQALGNFVDPRRTFAAYNVQFPYYLSDPNNLHIQNTGFPTCTDVSIARLSIPVSAGQAGIETTQPGLESICSHINQTHAERVMFRRYTSDSLNDRLTRIGTYSRESFMGNGKAVLGVWGVNERNTLSREGTAQELRLSFALDYGFTDLAAFEQLLHAACHRAQQQGTTHLSFMCDTRAEEYPLLSGLADDEQKFDLHTLPWITSEMQAQTVFCDAVYS